MKQILGILLVLSIFVLLVGCSAPTTTSSGTTTTISSGLSEKDRYVKANVALTCYMMGSEGNVVLGDEEKLNSLVAPYGFTMEEMGTLGDKYGAQESLRQDLAAEIMKQCPDAINTAQAVAAEYAATQ